jgi:type IV pilus assembly protein PilC
MPTFQYIAFDAQGREQTGEIEALDTAAATERVKQQGFFPTSITDNSPKRTKRPVTKTARGLRRINLQIGLGGGVRSKVLTRYTRQMATLIDAGMPLLRGLRLLEEQEKQPVLKRTIRNVAESVEGGCTFSDSLAQHPKIFSKLYINMVKAGEVAGALEVVLNRLAEFQEKAQKIKGKVIAAMVYPTVVLSISTLIVSFLLVVIVPKFQQIFSEMLEGIPLPPLTLMLLAVSNVLRSHFLAAITVVAVAVTLLKVAAKSPKGKHVCDAIKLRMPLFGQLVRKVSISRFTRTLGTLVSSGVPILQALTITRDTAGNAIVADAVERVHDAVKEGESIVQPLRASKVFPPMVVGMIGIGEETGALPEMLMKIADTYDDEVDNTVAGLTSIIEPIMIVGLALVIGTIVIALFLPMIYIMQAPGIGGQY